MLPSDLLTVWKRKGTISPRFAYLSDFNLQVADSLIKFYIGHLGEKKKVLKTYVNGLEDSGYDYRFVRGLSILLDRRGTFKSSNSVDSVDLRRKLYQAAGKLGLPINTEQRSRIIDAVASELKLTAEAVEKSFYADLDDELVLEKFDPLPAQELLEQYNLSLTQTLLFDSTEMSFTTSGNWQRIFHTIKRLGLIYEAQQDGRFWVKIDGPASLFRLTRRYGTAMAKLLPAITSNQEWTVEAKILWKYTNEICDFKIESSKHHNLLKSRMPFESYDSTVEEDFASRFQALKSSWRLKREPEPVLAGKQVIIPDFSLETQGAKVYLEIVGFWTSEYLLRKIEKLKKVNVNMLVLVNENLACQKLASLEKHPRLNITYYRDRIPLVPILRYLEEAFREVQSEQMKFLKDIPIVFTEPTVNFEELATRIGVSVEAVKAGLTENPPSNYMAMSDSLVRKDKLEQVGKKIDEQISRGGQLFLPEAAKIAETEGIEDTNGALKAIGYRIVWHGISADKAEVRKSDGTQH